MQSEQPERRKEERFPITTEAIVHKSCGESIPAVATNISSSGMLLHVEPQALQLNEEVTVEIRLPNAANQPFSSWGVAKVVRVDSGSYFGVQLTAGVFHS